MALALYRRYRPDTFDGVIGQDQVTVPLSRALDEGKLTHAYLFSGPRGCGKTSSARILARCVNCAKGPTSHPCGECESCRDLATGGPGSIDVVEIDAASHNGVDDARELRERAGFAPARDRYKIFILDEAHMVTQQGFNALLKIVEEPPDHVMFIFATTEPEKVIGTIRSRTHHYPFRLVPPEIMGPYLEKICDKEGIKPEPGVLKLAMRAGGGSMRDTLSVLDQLMVGAVDGAITHDASVALLGFTPDALISDAIDAVIDADGEKLYGVVQKVVVGGFDPRRFVEDLLSRVRDLLILNIAGERAESVLNDDAEAEDLDDLRRQAGELGLARLTSIADIINDALGSMSGATSPRMRLELLAARLLVPQSALAAAAPSEGVGMPAVGDGSASSGSSAANTQGGQAQGGQQAGQSGVHGFAGARRNAGRHSDAGRNGEAGQKQTSGFAGRRQTATAPAQSSQTQPVQPPSDQTQTAQSQPVQSSGWPVDDESSAVSAPPTSQSNSATQSAPQSQPAQTPQPAQISQSAQTPQSGHADDSRTPDEKWDALVTSLPDDVRQYVSRDRVPRVHLSPDPKTGRMRLWIKFANALNKYAFALGVASESVDGTTKVVDILRARTHQVFGPEVALAPTEKMADGQIAPPLSRLPADEQQRIKSQVLQESFGSLSAMVRPATASKSADSTEGSGSDSADGSAGSSDADADSDRGGSQVQQDYRPGQSDRLTLQDQSDQQDPWALPGTSDVQPYQDLSQQSERHMGHRHDGPDEPHHGKHVAVPDLSDDEDPWAVPVPSTVPSAASSSATATTNSGSPSVGTPGASSADPIDDPWRQTAPAPTRSSAASSAGPSVGSPSGAPVDFPDVGFDDTDPWQVAGRVAAQNAQAQSVQAHSAQSEPTGWEAAGRMNQPDQSWSGQSQSGQSQSGQSWPGQTHGQTQPGQTQPQPGPSVQPEHTQPDHPAQPQRHFDPTARERFAHGQTTNGAGPAGVNAGFGVNAAGPGLPTPQVDPEDDDYSMDDAALGSDTALDVEELKRMFDVKTVEDLAADDPNNPRNIAAKRQKDKESQN
ncbi:DNA polymerase III subunit gamma and tau [Bifidobacterium simiarum]|nr:DNA polymerase III subunit gamma and tau [Bifidobacterium simiarum]MBT1166348.1 DNA polymerase III subunit gamma and tau [Bifidobacterium simiarum]